METVARSSRHDGLDRDAGFSWPPMIAIRPIEFIVLPAITYVLFVRISRRPVTSTCGAPLPRDSS